MFDFYELSERIQGCSACRSGLGSHDKHVALASVIRNTRLVFGSFSARYILESTHSHKNKLVNSVYSIHTLIYLWCKDIMHLQFTCNNNLQYITFAYIVYSIYCMHTGICAVVHIYTHSYLFSPLGIESLWWSWKFLCLQSLTSGGKAPDTWDTNYSHI